MSVYGSREGTPGSPATEQPTSIPPQENHRHTQPTTNRDSASDATSPQLCVQQEQPSLRPPPPSHSEGGRAEHTEADIIAHRDSQQQHCMVGNGATAAGSKVTGAPSSDIASVLEDRDSLGRGLVGGESDTQPGGGEEGDGDLKHTPRDQRTDERGEKEEEEEKQSGGHSSDYHTPSPISDHHLQELSHDTAPHTNTESPPTTEPVTAATDRHRKRDGVKDTTAKTEEEEEEHADGVVFQPHTFPCIEPTTTLGPREDEVGVVGPKPHPLGPPVIGVDSERPHISSAFRPPEPSSSSREPVFVEDGSTVSSVASSFRETSHPGQLQKDYSSLSLDRHSDVEESGFQPAEGGGGANGGRHGDGSSGVRWGKGESAYLFPVSNSPVDLVTMLTRLASFTSTLLTTLTPRLRHGAVPGLEEPRVYTTHSQFSVFRALSY